MNFGLSHITGFSFSFFLSSLLAYQPSTSSSVVPGAAVGHHDKLRLSTVFIKPL